MLKIKDNVDLKELEKFGFRYDKDCLYKQLDYGHIFINNYRNVCIYNEKSNFQLDTLYDLIKADLVEKVEEE
jgi:hypothetical protein